MTDLEFYRQKCSEVMDIKKSIITKLIEVAEDCLDRKMTELYGAGYAWNEVMHFSGKDFFKTATGVKIYPTRYFRSSLTTDKCIEYKLKSSDNMIRAFQIKNIMLLETAVNFAEFITRMCALDNEMNGSLFSKDGKKRKAIKKVNSNKIN